MSGQSSREPDVLVDEQQSEVAVALDVALDAATHAEILDGPAGYTRIQTSGELEFKRKELGLKPAVWYGALTGGVVGRVVEFSRDTLRIAGDV